MRGEDEDLGNLHMLGGIGGIDSYIGDIVAGEGLNAFVDIGSTLGVAMEASVAEISFHKTRFEVGDADGSASYIEAESIGDGLYGSFGGTIDITVSIGSVASNRADIDDVAAVAFHHTRHH